MAIVPHKQIIGQQMATHSFDTKDAEKYGVESAVILYNLRHWLEKNKANGKHEHDGFFWTYNSAAAFEKLFPYMNRRTISRNLQKLMIAGVVVIGNYNQKGYDRTQWYTIPMEFASASNDSSNDTIGQNVSAIGQNVSAIGQNVSPIPDINTNNKPDSKQENATPTEPKVTEEKPAKKWNWKTDFDFTFALAYLISKNRINKDSIIDGIDMNLWHDWMEVRKEKRVANTQTAMNGQFQILIEITNTGMDANAAMADAIKNNWTGLGHYIEKMKPKINKARVNKSSTPADYSRYTLDDDDGFNFGAIDSYVVPTQAFMQIGA